MRLRVFEPRYLNMVDDALAGAAFRTAARMARVAARPSTKACSILSRALRGSDWGAADSSPPDACCVPPCVTAPACQAGRNHQAPAT